MLIPTQTSSYCQFVSQKPQGDIHRYYHDTSYGFPLHDDNSLFGRLLLEINQAGLSWTIILNKEKKFYQAYDGFQIKKIAGYQEKDRLRLLKETGIVRNHLKIEAAIHNAQMILALQKEFGSFKTWLDHHHQLIKQDGRACENWTKLFKKKFKFTGSEIVNEFLLSTGYLPGAHEVNCPVYKKILYSHPPWSKETTAI